ncbi:MAG TPA: hypothetical protein VGQ33_12755 [Vicinamibacteria bacterium]|nr:hypothetical protein [Vicinamibacteria bacterium]
MISFRATHVAVAAALSLGLADASEGRDPSELRADAATTVAVAGSGEDHLTTAIVHAQETTPTGKVQKSTEIVALSGDLKGFVLYHVTSVFDFAAGTLVNTGDQVFSGTVAGSAPVMIHDDQFRFRVNLATGEESGKVYLFDHIAGPKVRCQLDVVGTGLTAEGNPTFDYHGTCTFRGPHNR